MFTAVHNFDFRPNEKKIIGHAVIKTRILNRIYTLSHRLP